MPKTTTVYVCRECGGDSARWAGQCPHCQAWNTLEELALPRGRRAGVGPGGARLAGERQRAIPLSLVPEDASQRRRLGWDELNRVLGGGLVRGSVVLVGGEPGVGKSTLLLQMAAQLAAAGDRVLYASAEESAAQVRLRATRLGAVSERILMLPENDLDSILAASEPGHGLTIVDSIQTVADTAVDAAPGSVSQVRECAARLTQAAKRTGVPVVLVGHVTKDGAIAGPRVLEHMVDTVLYLEGERRHDLRILRATKNRFGSADEIGIFTMGDRGLAELDDPGGALLESNRGQEGTAVAVAIEGSRPLLVELQSLVGSVGSENTFARRAASGVDLNRLHMLLAVLEKKAEIKLRQADVYVNVAGGLHVSEPACDLALALSIVGSQRQRSLPESTVVVGEVSLTGEVRRVGQLERRLNEAARRGFRRALVPRRPAGGNGVPAGLELVEIADLTEAIAAVGLKSKAEVVAT